MSTLVAKSVYTKWEFSGKFPPFFQKNPQKVCTFFFSLLKKKVDAPHPRATKKSMKVGPHYTYITLLLGPRGGVIHEKKGRDFFFLLTVHTWGWPCFILFFPARGVCIFSFFCRKTCFAILHRFWRRSTFAAQVQQGATQPHPGAAAYGSNSAASGSKVFRSVTSRDVSLHETAPAHTSYYSAVARIVSH